MATVGAYAGSFDPPTKGHLWMIRQGAKMFDRLIVYVTINDAKTNKLLPDGTAVGLLKELVEMYGLKNVEVKQAERHKFLASQAKDDEAKWLLRGIRNGMDFGYEQQLRDGNLRICSDLETVFLMPPENLAFISSSAVREMIGRNAPHYTGWEFAIRDYLPRNVYDLILRYYNGLQSYLGNPDISRSDYFIPNIIWNNYIREWPSEDDPFSDDQGHRRYHTLGHLADMFYLYEKNKKDIDDRMEFIFAIWYHDAVYDPEAKDNEEKSFKLFKKTSNRLPDKFSERKLKKLIMATGPESEWGSNLFADKDCRIFRAMDLAILDTPPDERREYEWLVRQEYGWVPEADFNKARKEILNRISFLNPITTSPIIK